MLRSLCFVAPLLKCTLLIFLLALTGSKCNFSNDTYVSLPNKLYLGLEHKIFVRSAHPNTRVTVTTSKYGLEDEIRDPNTYYTDEVATGWHEVQIPYRVPFLLSPDRRSTTVTLNVSMTYCVTKACDKFTQHSLSESYQVVRVPADLLGETDKPLYRPGETIRFRFVTLTPQLLWPQSGSLQYPSQKLVKEGDKNIEKLVPISREDEEALQTTMHPVIEEISVYDPSETRVKQWLTVSPEQAFNLNYTLLADAPTGKWKVVARMRGSTEVTEQLVFTVKPYVLPRFTVSIKQPDTLSFESRYAQFSVCARYTNGPAMTGSVRAHLCVCSKSNSQSSSDLNSIMEDQACVSPRWRPERRPCIPTSGLLSPVDGCVSFNVSTEVLDLQSRTYPTWEQIPVICAEVEEQGTGSNVSRCESGTAVLQHTRARFELQAPKLFKPDLPVIGSVRLIHPDLSSLENVTIRVTAKENSPYCFYGPYNRNRVDPMNEYHFTQLLQTDATGRAQFSIPPISAKNPILLEVNYRSHTDSSQSDGDIQQRMILPRTRPPKPQSGVNAHQELERWLSHSRHSMIVWPSTDAVQVTCPGQVEFQVLANTPLNDKMFFVETVVRGRYLSRIIVPTTDPDPCVDHDDQLGHYRCVKAVGDSDQIECLPGWTGDNCLVPTCSQPCHRPGGVCSAPDTCTCFPYWSGPNCNVCTDMKQCGRSKVEVKEFPDEGVTLPEPESELQTTSAQPIPVQPEAAQPNIIPRRTLHLRNLSFPVDGNWGPEATVVVYFTSKEHSESGMIPVTINLQNIPQCMSPATAMEAEQTDPGLSLSQQKVSPGQTIQLTLTPQGLHEPANAEATDNQYCFVRMQDKSLDNFEGDRNLIDLTAISKLITKESKYYGSSDPYSLEQAFRAAGLRLMSTRVTEWIRPMPCPFVAYASSVEFDSNRPTFKGMPGMRRGSGIDVVDDAPSAPILKPRLRDFFPEVWLFDYYPIQWIGSLERKSANKAVIGRVDQTLTVPDTITSWRANAFCTTKSNGIWMPKPVEITTNMPFFLDITLPKQVRRGEILYLPLSVFVSQTDESGLTDCLSVSVQVELNLNDWSPIGGQAFLACVCPGEKQTFQLGLLAKQLGLLNVTVEAYARTKSVLCSGKDLSEDNSQVASRTFSDRIRRMIRVEAEGQRRDVGMGDILCLSESNPSMQAEFPIVLPHAPTYVSDSLRVYLSYSDEVLGPALANPDKLVRLPVGCGEQNMVLVAPNVYALDYFLSTGSDGNRRAIDKLKREAKLHIVTGYRRQLNYRHDDGSYSAFGKSDKQGSTWLTAFVLRVFAKAYKVDRALQIDWSSLFTETTEFLKQRQDRNTGCFEELGRVLHTGMQGGTGVGNEKELLLTAYILSAILETRPNNGTDFSPEFSPMIEAGRKCLYETHGLSQASKVKELSTYALAQLAYTLILLDGKSEHASLLQQELVKRQRRMSPPGLSNQLQYWLAKDPESSDNGKIDALDVETTSYALLTLSKAGVAIQELFPSIRWLSSHQKAEGGFFSTQDTVLALEAIAQFAKMLGLGNNNDSSQETNPLKVTATLDPVQFTFSDIVTDEKRHISNQVAVSKPLQPDELQRIKWTVTSSKQRKGCLAVHSSFIYHVHETASVAAPAFRLVHLVEQPREPPVNACTRATLSICIRPDAVKPQETGMLLVKVDMISGWRPIQGDILSQVSGDNETPAQIEFSQDDSVSVYFNGFTRTKADGDDWATNAKRCVKLRFEQFAYVKQANPALIQAMDYYATSRQVSQTYTLGECSSAWDLNPNTSGLETTVASTEQPQSTVKPVQPSCPTCELTGERNQTLIDNLLDYVCRGWSNFLGVKVRQARDNKHNVTFSSIGYGMSVSLWNATMSVGRNPVCECGSLISGAKLLWLSPNSKLNIEPGDPEVSIVTTDPEALLIPMDVAWPAVQMAREQWKTRGQKQEKISICPMRCSRIELLWRYIKFNLI